MADVRRALRTVFNVPASGVLPIVTGQRWGDRKRLAKLCAMLGYKVGVEIGVRSGGFSEIFCREGMEMWCVDPWSPCPNYSQARQDRHYAEAVKRLSTYNVHFVKKTSMDALADVPDEIDFIHIDGRHEFDYVMQDLILWCPKVRKGGLVAAHDYHLADVKHAIDAYTRAHRIDPWYVLKTVQPTAFWIQP